MRGFPTIPCGIQQLRELGRVKLPSAAQGIVGPGIAHVILHEPGRSGRPFFKVEGDLPAVDTHADGAEVAHLFPGPLRLAPAGLHCQPVRREGQHIGADKKPAILWNGQSEGDQTTVGMSGRRIEGKKKPAKNGGGAADHQRAGFERRRVNDRLQQSTVCQCPPPRQNLE